MSINIAPKIIASWIPNGKIVLKPQLFATVVKLDRATGDTLRKISNKEIAGADTIRKIKSVETINTDTLRKISNKEIVGADTLRKTSTNETAIADTLRKVKVPQGNIKINPKVVISWIPNDRIFADTLRQINNKEIIKSDTLRLFKEKVSGDTKRLLQSTEVINADTLRNIKVPQLERFSADTSRRLREKFSGNTQRKIVQSEKFKADTVIRRPYILEYCTENAPQSDIQTLMNTLKGLGIVSVNLNLNEMTLTDTISLESATHMNINEAIKGKLFNYEGNFLVDQTSHCGLIQSVNPHSTKVECFQVSFKETDYLSTIRFKLRYLLPKLQAPHLN